MPKHNIFEEFFEEDAALVDRTTYKKVPNVFPKIKPGTARIAIIGEAPGADEVSEGMPFVGHSGRELNKCLSHAGIVRDQCFIGNVCQTRPAGNKLTAFDWNGPQIQEGLSQLADDLRLFKPNIVICLGGTALHSFMAGRSADVPKRKSPEGLTFAYPNSISDWRGSFFVSSMDAPLPGVKCIGAYHPAACLRNYEWMPLLVFDIKKASRHAHTSEWKPPERVLTIDYSVDSIILQLSLIKVNKPLIAMDIEGYVAVAPQPGEKSRPYGMKCLSIATSETASFTIPFATRDGRSIHSVEDETRLWRALASVMADPAIPKVLQNSLYDRFVLQFSYDMVIKNVSDDTMLKHWELYSELEKSLGFQCSLYTLEPFYKEERTSEDHETYWRYCARDSAVTYEINDKLSQWLKGPSRAHYDFNVALLNPMLYMELRGIRYNQALAKERLAQVEEQIYGLQYELDRISGCGLDPSLNREGVAKLVQSVMCYKRDTTQPKKEYVECYATHMALLKSGANFTDAQRGRLHIDLGIDMNIKGDKLKTYLYETLKLPQQVNKKTGQLTTDYEALLKLSHLTSHRSVELALQIGTLRTRAQMLQIYPDTDGRIRAGYNVVGTETGRITCYTSPTGSGYNLQTIPSEDPLRPDGHPLKRGMRDLFTADEGYYLFQCDLSGADGWTVGAHLAALGERTMLDDLLARIKPAQRIAYMLRHGNDSLRGKEREEIKQLLKEIKKEDFDYFMCKCGIWGICYLMGVDRLADLIFVQSEGRIKMSRGDVANFRQAVYACYKPDIWHKETEKKLSRQSYPPKLTSASGHTRMFFGRYNEILGEALANEPQENTTYATNKAALNLYRDPENRTDKRLRIQPLHQVHDALLGQWPIADTAWAISKIKQYFDNTLIIAGQYIKIPFSGQYGTNWAFDKDSQVGTFE